MMTCDEECIRNIIKEELSHMGIAKEKKDKKKREPSKWNLFLKDCSSNMSSEIPMGQKAKECSVEYNKVKDFLVIENGELKNTKLK